MSDELQRKYNLKSPAVKRLMREAQELRDPTEQYFAQPLEDNLFEWHFTVRGPSDTDFADGRYHGRITLPPEYPMKPPSIILLTPNGRFELGKKICLSMSAHHPETWQPSWSIRTVLLAIIGFMPTKGGGAIGALDYTAAERKLLASKSKDWKCETCGMDHKDCLHEVDPERESSELNEARKLASQINFKGESASTKDEKSKQEQQQTPPAMYPYNYYSQYFNMETPAYPAQDNNQATQCAVTTTTNTSVVDTSLRQRTNIAPVQDNNSSPSQVSSSSQANHSTDNIQQRQDNSSLQRSQDSVRNVRNNGSTTDYITIVLMWIITAVIVLLILRRLAMEGTKI